MGQLQIFKSSFSKGYFLTTVLLTALFVHMIYSMAAQMVMVPMGSGRFYWMAFSIILLSYLLIFSFLSQIVSVNVDDERVIIQKMLGQIVIQRSDILAVTEAPDGKGNLNLFSLRGLFGSIGWFRHKELGLFFSLVKDDRQRVVIRSRRRCYVVSCDKKDDLLALFSAGVC